MKSLIVVLGDSGSGKTTLITELTSRFPNTFKRVVTCTSRPARAREVDGFDYHFFPESYFIDNPELILVKKVEGGLFYGTRRKDVIPTTRHLLLASRPSAIPKLKALGILNLKAIRMVISEELKIERMLRRGDTGKSVADRLKLDAMYANDIDMKGVPVLELHPGQALDETLTLVIAHANG